MSRDELTAVSGGGQSASLGYDSNGNPFDRLTASMTGVSGTVFGSWTLVFDDENRLTSLTYPSGGGSVTDLYYYNALGQRMRDRLNGVYTRYLYDGDRVLQEYNDTLSWMKRRNNYVGGSYYDLWLDTWRSGYGYRFPLYDPTGTARRLVDDTETVTNTYPLDAWGQQIASTGTTPNPYRGVYPERSRRGGAWGYITDPSGMLQLGARYYWPEIGRFISQDPIGEGSNWYAYADSNPVTGVDPEGLFKICWNQYKLKSWTKTVWGPWEYDHTSGACAGIWLYKYHYCVRQGVTLFIERILVRRCCYDSDDSECGTTGPTSCGQWSTQSSVAWTIPRREGKRVPVSREWGACTPSYGHDYPPPSCE